MILYYSSQCPHCQHVLDMVKHLGLTSKFKLVDVYSSMDAYNEASQCGVKHLPSFVDRGRVIYSSVPDEEKLKELAK